MFAWLFSSNKQRASNNGGDSHWAVKERTSASSGGSHWAVKERTSASSGGSHWAVKERAPSSGGGGNAQLQHIFGSGQRASLQATSRGQHLSRR
jgi:hypothetical protein